ncbi:MAG: TetR/AcrR family transcriptional regulator [Nitrospirae bacterium]|nr:TetR/AcrR family transcriptional regulator [Nitrospirota bacterium]
MDKRRTQILSAAEKIFAEKGYHAANIATIASKLRMGHGTFYRYFRNKLDIFNHVIEEVIQRIAKVVASEDPSATNTVSEYRAQVERLGGKLFTLFMEDPYLSKLIFYEALGIDESLNRKIQNAMDLFGEFTERYLRNGKEKGFLKSGLDTKTTALALNAIIFEAVRRIAVSADRPRAAQEWMRAVIPLMFEGVAA